MNGVRGRGSVTVASPADYTVFPQLVPLCQVKEVRGDFVNFCSAIAREEDAVCAWHRTMKREHLRGGRGHLWVGLEVRFP